MSIRWQEMSNLRRWRLYEAAEQRKYLVHDKQRRIAVALACERRGHGDAIPDRAEWLEAQRLTKAEYDAASRW